MSSADGSDGANPQLFEESPQSPAGKVDSLMVEALLHLLIEKGVVTKNDALGVVQTVIQVTDGAPYQGGSHSPETRAVLQVLQRLHSSFEALDGRPDRALAQGENVHWLRPPPHGDRPERDD